MKPGCWNGRHHLLLPDHVADWDATSAWEVERFDSMESLLGPADVLYDVGTEHGSLSAVYARWAGAMVLIEPTPDFWGNIRATWEANGLPMPLACWAGLLGGDSCGDALTVGAWPHSSTVGEVGPGGYRYLHEPGHADVPRSTLVDLVALIGVAPTALTIDVEGAEVEVLRGAAAVLDDHRPTVWVSIHPDLMARDYGAEPADVYRLMAGHGYHGTLLGVDHEEHHLFTPLR